MKPDIQKQFFTDTDHTGRFIVTSIRTGRTYAVEPIGSVKTNWGDINPSTKQVEGSYGTKYRGSIDEKESLITQENGFTNIIVLEPGTSPHAAIEQIDAKYPTKGN